MNGINTIIDVNKTIDEKISAAEKMISVTLRTNKPNQKVTASNTLKH